MKTSPESARLPRPHPDDLESAQEEHLDRIWRKAYAAKSRDDLRELYAEWAASYDEDHARIGFFGHRLAAHVLARHTTRHDNLRVLDAGAGTGAAGQVLSDLGFRHLVAVDLSPEMLVVARAKGLYENTVVADLSLPIDDLADDSFDAAVLVGVFSYGQAPAVALDEVLRAVRPGGVVVLTMRTDFHEEDAMGIRSRAEALARDRVWRLLEVTEPLPYLPGKDADALFRVWCYRVVGRTESEVEEGFQDAVREAFEDPAHVIKLDHSWIWDSRASRLYDRYTRTAGYYLTDCEEEIVQRHAAEIWGEERLVVELGCGSARKIRHVLRAGLERSGEPVTYLPIDVSPGALRATSKEVEQLFPAGLEVTPRQGLFEDVLHEIPAGPRKLVFFFGSSIGNLDSIADTVAFLRSLGAQLSPGDRLVLGIDLHKDADVLERAYNEEEDCREFFVHMVRRINEHLGADFDPRVFELSSTYHEEAPYEGVQTHRMNLRIAPREPQHTWVRELGLEVQLEPGQPIQVGISRKYSPASIARLAALSGFRLERQWLDSRGWFSLNEFVLVDA